MSSDDVTIGELFAGYSGLGMGVQQAIGGRIVWVSDNDPGAARVLNHHHPDIPNHGDITTIDFTQVAPVRVICAGFPCQDVSNAGARKGLTPGTRTGLWSYVAQAVETLKPELLVFENVRGLLSAKAHSNVEPCPWCLGEGTDSIMRAHGAVLSDLADIGYDTAWCGLPASAMGAPHKRFRVVGIAYPTGQPWRTTADPRGETVPVGTGLRESNTPGFRRGRSTNSRPKNVPLLPTPAVNDMGEGKTIDWWDEWAPKQKAADGTRAVHGKSLAIEAQRLLPTPTSVRSTERGGDRKDEPQLGGISTSNVSLTDVTAREAREWGDFTTAIRTGEQAIGRPAPDPTQLNWQAWHQARLRRLESTKPIGHRGSVNPFTRPPNPQLSPLFVEWMMMLPAGHVTDPTMWDGLPEATARNAQLKLLGNGCVPPQICAAVTYLIGVTQ